jgi:hypothetical protein
LDPTIQRLIGMTPLPNNFASTVGDGLNTAGYTWLAPEEERTDGLRDEDRSHVQTIVSRPFVRISKGHQNTDCDSANTGESFFPGLPCLVNTQRESLQLGGQLALESRRQYRQRARRRPEPFHVRTS